MFFKVEVKLNHSHINFEIMSTTENHGYFRFLTRLMHRIFFRGIWRKAEQDSRNKTFKSFHNDLSHSNASYHGDEEAFWFI